MLETEGVPCCFRTRICCVAFQNPETKTNVVKYRVGLVALHARRHMFSNDAADLVAIAIEMLPRYTSFYSEIRSSNERGNPCGSIVVGHRGVWGLAYLIDAEDVWRL